LPKPRRTNAANRPRLNVAIVTGSRADFGLLRPVIDAVCLHRKLTLQLIACGSHLLPPSHTIGDVEAAYPIAARVPMQIARQPATRAADALAVARGVGGFARAFAKLQPDWVVVLGDRIEAFAAAAAASIAGLAVAHIHGGDRAEGIADEAMRHAISKLAHLHCAASPTSAERLIRMGERPEHVQFTGSPALDGLRAIKPLTDAQVAALGTAAPSHRGQWSIPKYVFLLHPSGLPQAQELAFVNACIRGVARQPDGHATLAFAPNHDAGREHTVAALNSAQLQHGWRLIDHLPRGRFLALLKWTARHQIPLVGNSSAGLIECAALNVPVVNLGQRQAGRERVGGVLDIPEPQLDSTTWIPRTITNPARDAIVAAALGTGRAGRTIAGLLASTDPHSPALLRKRNAY